MAYVKFESINKVYPGGITAVSDFNLTVKDKEFLILVGPSGCGKTTTLRMVAGLEEISDGELYIDDKLVNKVQPKDRDIAMVFQNYALYPHMTVYDNMSFGLKFRKLSKKEIDRRVVETAKNLDIEHLLKRKPKALSGGQKQRVALGRAIVRDPKVFLMDEPLSNLDAKLRVQMRTELSKLHHNLEATIIYVTHDQTEAMTMGSRIAVMKDGVIQQVDTPQTVYQKPVNMFVAGFIGSPQMNFIKATVQKTGESESASLVFNGFSIKLDKEKSQALFDANYENQEIIFGIRPENINIESEVTDQVSDRELYATVEVVEMHGSEIILHLKLGQDAIVAKVPSKWVIRLGDEIKLAFDASRIYLFDPTTGMTIAN